MIAHRWINRLQTLLGIAALAGWLLLGDDGLWMALGAAVLALLLEPGAASWLTLRLYQASPLPPAAAPDLWRTLEVLAQRAGRPASSCCCWRCPGCSLWKSRSTGWGLILLALAPHIALLAQLGLSRVREFDADRTSPAYARPRWRLGGFWW